MTPKTKSTRALLSAALAIGLAIAAGTAQAEPEKVAVFDFQFAQGAPLPPTEDDQARLKRTADEFRQLLKDSGKYEVISTEPVKDQVAKTVDLRSCGGCADEMGRKLGADATFVGEVQKVSNLILNMNVYLKGTKEGAREQAFSVDLRGNTDESFDRGIKYLVKNQLMERAK